MGVRYEPPGFFTHQECRRPNGRQYEFFSLDAEPESYLCFNERGRPNVVRNPGPMELHIERIGHLCQIELHQLLELRQPVGPLVRTCPKESNSFRAECERRSHVPAAVGIPKIMIRLQHFCVRNRKFIHE